MADRKMRRLFREAADIARGVPREFQQAAFNRAVDLLVAKRQEEGEAFEEPTPGTRSGIFGNGPSQRLINLSVDALRSAAGTVGIESVSAGQVADMVRDRFGVPTSLDVVDAALERAGDMVEIVRSGPETLYRFVTPTRRKKADAPAKQNAEKASAKTARPTASKKSKAAKAKKSTAKASPKKKPTAGATTPTQVIMDLVSEGFFRTSHTVSDVVRHLERQGVEYTARQLAPVLMRFIQQELLERRANARGEYVYRAAE